MRPLEQFPEFLPSRSVTRLQKITRIPYCLTGHYHLKSRTTTCHTNSQEFLICVSLLNVFSRFIPGLIFILDDGDFCIIPLMADCKSNPFRCRKGSSEGSRFLLHAVLALSVHHIAASTRDPKLVTEMLLHRSSAMHLYRMAMDDSSNNLALLDTMLIMMHVDVSPFTAKVMNSD
jgi:hypothetical protein